jgi:hypothetical protein
VGGNGPGTGRIPEMTTLSPPTVRKLLAVGTSGTATANTFGGVLLTTSLKEYERILLTWPLTLAVRLYVGSRLSDVTQRSLVCVR